MTRRPLAAALVVGLTAAVVLSGCTSSSSSSDPDVASPVTGTSGPAATTTAPAVPRPVTPATAAPTKAPRPTVSPTVAKPAFDLRAVQTRLEELDYYLGEPDGEPGLRTSSAVQAFQKVNGLTADGDIGPKTLAALKKPKAPKLRGGLADRVEVDLTKQVLYVVKRDRVQRILPISSGSGETYFQKDGDRATSLTPKGFFRIERRIVGLREADLGSLYDPQYFYKGWAIHGSNSVPPYPASHGCVRVTRADATWLLEAIDVGMPVYLYGGEHVFEAGSAAPGTDDPGGDVDSPVTPLPPVAPKPTTTKPAPRPVPTTTPPAPVETTPAPGLTLGPVAP